MEKKVKEYVVRAKVKKVKVKEYITGENKSFNLKLNYKYINGLYFVEQ